MSKKLNPKNTVIDIPDIIKIGLILPIAVSLIGVIYFVVNYSESRFLIFVNYYGIFLGVVSLAIVINGTYHAFKKVNIRPNYYYAAMFILGPIVSNFAFLIARVIRDILRIS